MALRSGLNRVLRIGRLPLTLIGKCSNHMICCISLRQGFCFKIEPLPYLIPVDFGGQVRGSLVNPWKLKQNIISEWRKVFLSNENCLELESSMITHSRVFDASGHTKKFTDLVVKDLGRFLNWCLGVSLWLADISRAAFWLAETVTLLASIWKPSLVNGECFRADKLITSQVLIGWCSDWLLIIDQSDSWISQNRIKSYWVENKF